MSKASIARHAKFRSEVSAALLAVGATIIEDRKDTLAFRLQTPRIGPLVFTMFKRDMDSRPKDELYSLYAQLPCNTNAEVAPIAKKVNDQFGRVPAESMNRFSGKWNLHYSDPKDVLNMLDYRLAWLMDEG